jgi:hypothetical protein
MSGLSKVFRRWSPDRDLILDAMQAPVFRRIRLERFPRGIDNVRVDVALDPRFVSAASTLVGVVLREDVQRYFWKQAVKAPSVEAADVFRLAYTELSQSVVSQARALSRPERVQLFQLAVFKLLMLLVDQEMKALREELEHARAQPARQQSGQSLELHERAVILARYAQEIRFRTLKDLLRLVMRIEQSSLRKVRKTIMGISWPLSEQMLNAPALQLGGRGSAEDFVKFFPYVLYDESKAVEFVHHIFAVLGDWLPEGVEVPGIAQRESLKEDRSRGELLAAPGLIETERCVMGLVGEQERLAAVPHVFDDAQAVVELFGGLGDSWPKSGRWGDRRLLGEFKRRFSLLQQRLRKAGLLKEIYASHLLQLIYPGLGASNCVEPVYAYVLGAISRRELLNRLSAKSEVEDAGALVARIDEQLKANKGASAADRRNQLLQCVHDAVYYRFQFKLTWWLLNGLEDVHLLFEAREQDMSRANSLLQTFSIGADQDAEQERAPAGHVILKADLRGSSEITASMRLRNLNPAAYFSRNFYDPITALAGQYGAEKVFVEGDAVILAVDERAGESGEQLAVARACGLAQRMLEVVERKNARSRRMGLPMLEMGIGIAYSNETPTYLYDEGHKIMISPAINRADRLSSCDPRLRSLLEAQGVDSGVQVVNRVTSQIEDAAGEYVPVRFNVNGIELEPAAFYQLVSGLKLHSLRLPGEDGIFHVGRYPDLRGTTHWLVVHDAPVRTLLGNQILDAATEERQFHQVVTDKRLLGQVRTRLAGKR